MGKVLRELSGIFKIGGAKITLLYLREVFKNLPQVMSTRNLSPADLGMSGRKYKFKVLGEKLILDGKFFAGAREIFGRKVYFQLPGFSLTPTDVVVDLGANVGLFSVLAARLSKTVIAVEAQSGFVDEIVANARENECLNNLNIEFGIVGPNSGIFKDREELRTASHYGIDPPTLTMANLIAKYGVNAINFLKVDIEGSEFDWLNCDTNWLSHVEKVAMEIHSGYGDPNEMADMLRNKGFIVWLVANNGEVVEEIKESSGYLFAKRNGPRTLSGNGS